MGKEPQTDIKYNHLLCQAFRLIIVTYVAKCKATAYADI
ncbi:hypothetical protein TUMEXPCC7403_08280 [Tumidithrix helvetica PCC 7403]